MLKVDNLFHLQVNECADLVISEHIAFSQGTHGLRQVILVLHAMSHRLLGFVLALQLANHTNPYPSHHLGEFYYGYRQGQPSTWRRECQIWVCCRIWERTSTRLPFGFDTCGIRQDAERLRAE